MHIGIDLGTTFCCVSYIDKDGIAKVIPSSDGELSTPSIIWFDGNAAIVGKKADNMKNIPGMNNHIYEFVKRDIGKPVEFSPDVETDGIAPYEIRGFKYGAAGLSAIILRKLKIEAIHYLKNRRLIDSDINEKSYKLDAVITVPAYFGDKERQDTKLAGMAAGLNVIGIINEPTAAALAYGLGKKGKIRILVFDLGGGTFDVTILEMERGNATVLASDGANTLGGKDWDELIQEYIYNEFAKRNNTDIKDDKGYYVQQKALNAKFALTDNEQTNVQLLLEDGDLDLTVYRSSRYSDNGMDQFAMDNENFYFEQVSTNLLARCKRICTNLLEKSGLSSHDIDEVIIAGGACRMPMIQKMLEKLFGDKVQKNIKGFNYDTAIAIGAAYYGLQKGRVKDIVSHSIGIKCMENNRYFIEHLIKKNSQLPFSRTKEYNADEHATLSVYEGESIRPDECTLRGRIELDNPEGKVKIIMHADTNGILKVTADYPPHGQKAITIKHESYMFDERLEPLRERIQAITINL